jgi:uncharacterized membrane protein YkvA (DUF1232 family)
MNLNWESISSFLKKFMEDGEKEGISKEQINEGYKKSENLKDQKDNFLLLLEMIKDIVTSKYKNISGKTKLLLIGTVLYVISPIDAIPDIIPFAGWIDDMGVISYTIGTLKEEIKKYKDWKYINQKNTSL